MPTVISPITLIQYTEQRLTKIRDRLESMFNRLLIIHDVIVVNAKALESQNTDLDSEMARVLRRCGSDKLHGQLQSLNHIIEQFGGTT